MGVEHGGQCLTRWMPLARGLLLFWINAGHQTRLRHVAHYSEGPEQIACHGISLRPEQIGPSRDELGFADGVTSFLAGIRLIIRDAARDDLSSVPFFFSSAPTR
jgi:hypothetical protein